MLLGRLGRRAAALAAAIGPAGIKFAQALSARRDLLPGPLLTPLRYLQDEVPAPSEPALRRMVATALGADAWQSLAIETRPLGSGSVAVVLAGRAAAEGALAIKLLRPGVAQRIERDLRVMLFLARLVTDHERLRHLDLGKVLPAFAASVRGQCDLTAEAAAATRLRRVLGANVLVPETLCRASGENALVMRRLFGRRLDDPTIGDLEFHAAMAHLLEGLYRMIFVEGLVHVDLHPGNVRIAEDGRPIVFDFGLVASITPVERRRFRDFFLAVAQGRAGLAATHLIAAAAARPPTVDRDRVAADLSEVIRRRQGQSVGSFLVLGFVDELFEIQRRHGLRGAPGFEKAAWALTLFEGLVRDRCPSFDFQTPLRRYAVGAMIERMERAAWASGRPDDGFPRSHLHEGPRG